jgi:hypothetical protein
VPALKSKAVDLDASQAEEALQQPQEACPAQVHVEGKAAAVAPSADADIQATFFPKPTMAQPLRPSLRL